MVGCCRRAWGGRGGGEGLTLRLVRVSSPSFLLSSNRDGTSSSSPILIVSSEDTLPGDEDPWSCEDPRPEPAACFPDPACAARVESEWGESLPWSQ